MPKLSCAGFCTSFASRIAPAQVPKTGFSRANSRKRLFEIHEIEELEHGGALAPRNHQAVDALQLLGGADEHGFRARAFDRLRVRFEIALQRENPDPFSLPGIYQPRVCISSLFGQLRDIKTGHRHSEILARFEQFLRVVEICGCLYDRFGARFRIFALENARADEHRLSAQLQHERGVGRRRDAARREVRHGQLAVLRHPLDQFERRARDSSPRAPVLPCRAP